MLMIEESVYPLETLHVNGKKINEDLYTKTRYNRYNTLNMSLNI